MPPKSLTTSHVPRKLIRAWFNELVCGKCTVPKSETTILRNSFISGNKKIGSCLQCALLQLFLYVFTINKNTFSLKAESVQSVVQHGTVRFPYSCKWLWENGGRTGLQKNTFRGSRNRTPHDIPPHRSSQKGMSHEMGLAFVDIFGYF
jgi:hypothetical protein